MSKKSEFIEYVRALRVAASDEVLMSEGAQDYWEALCNGNSAEKPVLTDNGKLIIKYLQELPSDAPMMKSKEIAEGMFVSSRAVAGAMRKLVSDGFVEKIGQDPTFYAITEKGKNIKIED